MKTLRDRFYVSYHYSSWQVLPQFAEKETYTGLSVCCSFCTLQIFREFSHRWFSNEHPEKTDQSKQIPSEQIPVCLCLDK